MAKKKGMDFKGLMLKHVEKLACAIIAVCFAFLLWAAFSGEGMEAGLAPADIEQIAAQANTNITRTTWDEFTDKPQMRNFMQESGWYDVPTEPYELTVSWNPDLFPKQDLRADPKYYPLQELEAHFDQGPLVLLTAEVVRNKFQRLMQGIPPEVQKQIDEARPPLPKLRLESGNPNKIVEGAEAGPIKVTLAGAQVESEEVSEGRRWVMVTGLLPWQAQFDAYVNKFRNAAGYDQKGDLPYYFGYEVERADVTGGVEPVWTPHDKISSRALQIAMVRWSPQKRTEIIAKPNRHEIFTWPLAPRSLVPWGNRDKHSKIKTQSAEESSGNTPLPMPVEVDPLGGLGEVTVEAPTSDESNSAPEHVQYKMLRYFDFDVQPGRVYQYRFRVALRDPNYVREGFGSERGLRRVEIKLLDERVVQRLNNKRAALEQEGLSPADAERFMPVVFTEWSDPSPAVKVPPDLYVLSLSAEQPPEGRYNSEPSTSILVTKYDNTLGIEVGAETKLQRGNLINFTADGIRIINVDHSTLETRKFPFNPNALLLDIRGSESIGEGSLTAPTETLMMDLDKGKLFVADEVEDAESVREFRQRKAQIDKLAPSNNPSPVGIGGPRDTDIIKP